jgi:hypothetical protein
MKPFRPCLTVVALLFFCAVSPSAALAQLQTGNLYGTVADEQGSPLPGVTVTLTGQGEPQVYVTNAQGQFRFLGLPPGQRQLKTELEGFSTVDYPNIGVNVGRNTTIEVTQSAAVENVITVTDESPVLDERRIATGRTVAQIELEKIPTARDPWVILQQTPGVLMDRVNVGGNVAGQQSQYLGPGVVGDQAAYAVDGIPNRELSLEDFANILAGKDLVQPKGPGTYIYDPGQAGAGRVGMSFGNILGDGPPTGPPAIQDGGMWLLAPPGVLTDRINIGGNEAGQQSQYVSPGGESPWSVDGVVITDMAALGSPPTYYNFDSFEEMQVGTGGNDAPLVPGGVVLNMVTKRGTNEWRGSGRYLISDEDRDAMSEQWMANPRAFQQGNRIVSVEDYGAEFGSPIIKDRLWIWGSYGTQEVDQEWNWNSLQEVAQKLTVDANGNDATSPDFDPNNIVQFGYGLDCNIPGGYDVHFFGPSPPQGTDACPEIERSVLDLFGTGTFLGYPDPYAMTTIHLGGGEPTVGRIGGVAVDPSDPSGNTVYVMGADGGTWKATNFLTTSPAGPTWNQAKFGPDPTANQIEDTHIFSSNFYLTGLYSVVNGGFQLVPGSQAAPLVPLDGYDEYDFAAAVTPLYLPDAPFVNRLYGESSFSTFVAGGKWRWTAPDDPLSAGLNVFHLFDRKDFTLCPNGTSVGAWNAGNPVDLGNGSSFVPFIPVQAQELCEDEEPQEEPTDELVTGVEHALLPEFVVGLNLTYRQVSNILEEEAVQPVQLNPAFLNGFPTLPLNQTFGSRFRFRYTGGGQSATDQQGPGGSIAPASVSGTPDPTSILLVSLGQSTGEAFRAHITGDVPTSIDGIAVLEPVAAPPAEVARFEQMMKDAGAAVATVEAYCFQFDGLVPPAGTAYRFAPPEIQKAFEPLARVLDAGQRVKDAGGLVPDTQLDTYFPAISQWAVWTREKGFDLESFGEAWLGHVKKNVEQAGERMTDELEQAVRERIPGRWRDIEKILAEADRIPAPGQAP